MEAYSSHTNRHLDAGLAQDFQRRPCDEARSEHEYLAAHVRFQISDASFWLIAVSMAPYMTLV